jgi:hypothetical protein
MTDRPRIPGTLKLLFLTPAPKPTTTKPEPATTPPPVSAAPPPEVPRIERVKRLVRVFRTRWPTAFNPDQVRPSASATPRSGRRSPAKRRTS